MDAESGHVATDFAHLSIKFTQSHRSESHNLKQPTSDKYKDTKDRGNVCIASNSTN